MRIRLSIALAGAFALAIAGAAQARNSGHAKHGGRAAPVTSAAAGAFDYYVMALSWSPTYCEMHPDEDEQCAHKGYGFVLHGLWPQYERGGGPELCSTEDEPDRKTIANALAFMPSRRLINHEWRAHGACTGLDAAAYFALADRAFAVVHVPPEMSAPSKGLELDAAQIRAAFRRANAKLGEDMLSLHCSRGELVEVRVCLDKNLDPRSCGKRMQSRCPATATFSLPASR